MEKIIEMLINTERATGADFSSHKGGWDIKVVEHNGLLPALDFAILRGGFAGYSGSNALDTRFLHNYGIMQDYPHIPLGVYWYPTIHVPWEEQRDFIIERVVGDRKFEMIIVDLERQYNLVNGRIPGSFVAVMLRLLKHLDRQYPDVKIMVYCDWYFMRDVLMPYSTEYTKFPWWIAYYPWRSWANPGGRLLDYLDEVFMKRNRWPTLPPGYPDGNAKIWQIAAGSMLGEEFGFQSDELDINVSLEKRDQFMSWLQFDQQPDPDPEPGPDAEAIFWDGYNQALEDVSDELADMKKGD